MFPQDRPNPPDLVPFERARSTVLDRLRPLQARMVGITQALGAVLAEDVAAPVDLPPFANSAMDGFAVRAADLAGVTPVAPARLRVTGEVFAGTGGLPTVEPGTAVRIMTGGAIPPGADAVVPVEQVRQLGDGQGIAVGEALAAGAFTRPAGEDVRAGTVVVRAGAPLTAAAIGMLASTGRHSVLARPRPRVCVVSTGDELVDPGESLGPGQIYDSNSWLLVAQAQAAGATAVRYGRIPDDEQALREGFAAAAAGADVVLTSGGVSVGDRDYTRRVLPELGDVRHWRVAMQPGMPQVFGRIGEAVLYGLPGNPVSCFVVFEVLVRPLLRRLAGLGDDALDRPRVLARLADPVRSPAGKVSFLRVALEVGEAGLRARLTGAQGSGVLSSCVAADGLAVVPPDARELRAGAEVSVILLRDDLGWVV